jgi:hypothetical protein
LPPEFHPACQLPVHVVQIDVVADGLILDGPNAGGEAFDESTIVYDGQDGARERIQRRLEPLTGRDIQVVDRLVQ